MARFRPAPLLLLVALAPSCSKKNEVSTHNDVCEQSFQDCNQDPADGCESNTTQDVDNCGACGQACSDAHGQPTCDQSRCGIVCEAGWDDCNHDVSDGCEVHTDTDLASCGACGAACDGPHATLSCIAGECKVDACLDDRTDCNADGGDGCERDLDTDSAHCGSCNHACDAPGTSGTCAAGSCSTACVSGFHDCAGTCKRDTSPDSCGTSCTPCTAPAGATATCTAGACGVQCPGSESYCAGTCVDLAGDGANCGACGHDCGGGACSAGQCQALVVASGLGEPRVVALGDGELFVATASGQIYRGPASGGSPSVFLGSAGGVKDMVVHGGNLLLSDGKVISLANGATLRSRADLSAWSYFQGHVLVQGTELDPEFPATSRYGHLDAAGVAPRMMLAPSIGAAGVHVAPLFGAAFDVPLASQGAGSFYRWQAGGVIGPWDGAFSYNNTGSSWIRVPVGGTTTTVMGSGAPIAMVTIGGENYAVIQAPSGTDTTVVAWKPGDTSVQTLLPSGRATSITADERFLYVAQASDGTVLRLARPVATSCAQDAARCSAGGRPQTCQAGAWVDGSACQAGDVCDQGACVPCATGLYGTAACGTVCVDLDRDAANCGACGAACAGTCRFGRCVETVALQTIPTGTTTIASLLGAVGGQLFTLHTTSISGTFGGVVTTYQPDGTLIARTNANIAFTSPGSGGGSHDDVRVRTIGDAIYTGGSTCLTCAGSTSLYTATAPNLASFTAVPNTGNPMVWQVDADGLVLRRGTTANASPCELRTVPNSGPQVVLLADVACVTDYHDTSIAIDASFVYYLDVVAGHTIARRVPRGGGAVQTVTGSDDALGLAVVGSTLYALPNGSWSTSAVNTPPTPVAYFATSAGPLRTDGTSLYWIGKDLLGVQRAFRLNGAATPGPIPNVGWGSGSSYVMDGASAYAPSDGYVGGLRRFTPR